MIRVLELILAKLARLVPNLYQVHIHMQPHNPNATSHSAVIYNRLIY